MDAKSEVVLFSLRCVSIFTHNTNLFVIEDCILHCFDEFVHDESLTKGRACGPYVSIKSSCKKRTRFDSEKSTILIVMQTRTMNETFIKKKMCENFTYSILQSAPIKYDTRRWFA